MDIEEYKKTRKFEGKDLEKREKAEYVLMDADYGMDEIPTWEEEELERPPIIFMYEGNPIDFEVAFRAGDKRLYDISKWSWNSYKGEELFTSSEVRANFGCSSFFAWQIILSSRIINKEQEWTLDSLQIPSYQYCFRNVDKSSLQIYRGPVQEGILVNQGTMLVEWSSDPAGVLWDPPPPVVDMLYELELGKARKYLEREGKSSVKDDWLYSLAMYDRHKLDVKRAATLVGNQGNIISYGDRVASFPDAKEYYDTKPSAYSLRPVRIGSFQILCEKCSDKNNLLLLMYVYDLMSQEEQEVLLKAQAKIVVWSEAPKQEFPYVYRGISCNFQLRPEWYPTEEVHSKEFPYSENFALLLDRVFLDLGIGVELYSNSKFFSSIPVHKDVLPNVTAYNDMPFERRAPKEGGHYVAHDFKTWFRFRKKNPYFVPIGRPCDRVLPVSIPMYEYHPRTLYSFRRTGIFNNEFNCPAFRHLVSDDAVVIGFFQHEVISPSLLVLELSISPGLFYIYRSCGIFIVETKRRTFQMWDQDSLTLCYSEMLKPERKMFRDAVLAQYYYPQLSSWLDKIKYDYQ